MVGGGFAGGFLPESWVTPGGNGRGRVWLSVCCGLLVVVVSLLAVASAFGVSGSDTITTIAGTGTAGFAGDGGQATSAQLNFPIGVAVDAQGNVFVADEDNDRDPEGERRDHHDGRRHRHGRVFGRRRPGDLRAAQLPHGVAVDAAGNLYIADTQQPADPQGERRDHHDRRRHRHGRVLG